MSRFVPKQIEGAEHEYYKKGLWTMEEDKILMDYVRVHGKGKWSRISKMTGLKRSGKSCRLRWVNYLCPTIKRGDFSEQEDDLIIRLHNLLGNRWAQIAARVPGRTDNQVKNHWNTQLRRKMGTKMEKSKADVSSLTHSSDEGKTLDLIPIVSNSKLPCDSNGVIGLLAEIENSIQESGKQEPMRINEWYDSSFWSSTSDDLNPDIPSYMEILNGYLLDEQCL